jgi:hypothetical protein
MEPHPFIARIDRRWRARRVLKRLMLCHPVRSEDHRYYRTIYDATFFIA